MQKRSQQNVRSWKANGLVGTDSGGQWNLKLHACWGKGVRGDKGQETKKPREAPERELSTSEDVDEVGQKEDWLKVWIENWLLDPQQLLDCTTQANQTGSEWNTKRAKNMK